MTIIICSENGKKKRWIPTCLIKGKLATHFLEKEEKGQFEAFILPFYKELKKYIKENGHFTLVEINGKDKQIFIRV